MSIFLNIIHYSIYFLSLMALLSLIFRGSKAKLEALYISGMLIIQSIYNGCPLTTLQNHFWIQEGLIPAENNFIFSSIFPENILLIRVLTFFIGLYLLYTAINKKKP